MAPAPNPTTVGVVYGPRTVLSRTHPAERRADLGARAVFVVGTQTGIVTEEPSLALQDMFTYVAHYANSQRLDVEKTFGAAWAFFEADENAGDAVSVLSSVDANEVPVDPPKGDLVARFELATGVQTTPELLLLLKAAVEDPDSDLGMLGELHLPGMEEWSALGATVVDEVISGIEDGQQLRAQERVIQTTQALLSFGARIGLNPHSAMFDGQCSYEQDIDEAQQELDELSLEASELDGAPDEH